MSITNAIRQMLAAGLTIDQALTAAEIMEANAPGSDPALERRRASDAERQRRRRQKERNVMSRDNRDNRDPSPLGPPLFPQTPNSPPIIPPSSSSVSFETLSPAARESFSKFCELYPPKRLGKPDEAFALAAVAAGDPQILVEALRAAVAEAKREDRAERWWPFAKKWLDEQLWLPFVPKEPARACRWTGPPEIRAEVVDEAGGGIVGEEFARSWLDPCEWTTAGIVAPHGFCLDKLTRLHCLRHAGISLFAKRRDVA